MAKKYGVFPEMTTSNGATVFGQEYGRSSQWVLMGELAEYGRRRTVQFDVSKEKVISIVGRRGQGKSYTLGAIVEGLCTAHDSPLSAVKRDRAVILFDPLNIFQWTYIPLSQADNDSHEMKQQRQLLSGWDLEPVPLNVQVWVPAGYRSPQYPARYKDLYLGVADFTLDDWAALTGFDVVRDIMGQYLSALYHKVAKLGWEDSEGSRHLPKERYSIQDLITCSMNSGDEEKMFFREDTIRAVRQRLSSYAAHPIFSGQGTPLTDILRAGTLSIVLLNRLPEDLRTVLVAALARRIVAERAEASETMKDVLLNTALSQGEREAKQKAVAAAIPKTWVVIDEIQTILPADTRTAATDALIKLIKEGRNFGLSFMGTTQQPRAVHATAMSQTETFFIHRLVSQGDIECVMANLKSPSPDEIKDENRALKLQDLIRELPVGYVAVSDSNTPRAFVMAVRPRISAHGGFEA